MTLNLDPDFFEPRTTLIPTLILATMALTEKEWAAMTNKYKYRIDTDKATRDELVKFIQLYIYKTQDLINTDLWVIFKNSSWNLQWRASGRYIQILDLSYKNISLKEVFI